MKSFSRYLQLALAAVSPILLVIIGVPISIHLKRLLLWLGADRITAESLSGPIVWSVMALLFLVIWMNTPPLIKWPEDKSE